jgi:hypothetical protein
VAVAVPENRYLSPYVVFAVSLTPWMIWSISSASALRDVWSTVSEEPSISRSLARWTYWVIESSAASVEFCQSWAS